MLAALLCAIPIIASGTEQMNTNGEYCLSSSGITLSFDESGRLVRLTNSSNGRQWLCGGDNGYLITVNTSTGDIWKTNRGEEIILRPDDAQPVISLLNTENGQALEIQRTHAVPDGTITVTQRITLLADSSCAAFDMTIDNHSENAAVTQAEPIRLTGLKDGEEALNLLWPDKEGKLYTAVMTKNSDASQTLSANYPSLMSMQFLTLYNQQESLYFGVHDAQRAYKTFNFSAHEGSADISCVQWPFVGAGESKSLATVYIGLMGGGWYEGADYYRAYLIDNGFCKTYAPIARTFTGFTSTCLARYKNRYDAVYINGSSAKYDMATISRTNQRAYGNPLTVYIGWHSDGFDSRYPDYEFIEDYGGADAFRTGVMQVHESGGKVIPYLNLHIADTLSTWYNEKGTNGLTNGVNCAILTKYNTVLHEQYGTGLDYVAMCPMAQEWQDALVDAVQRLRDCGVDGLWLDQMMEMPGNLCYNRSHGHSTPATAYAEGYDSLMKRIDEAMRSGGDDYFYCCEGVCDAYIQSIDICGLMWARKPGSDATTAQQITRYTMPCKFLGLSSAGAAIGSQAQYQHAWVLADGMLCADQNPIIKRYAALAQKYSDIYFDGRYMDVNGLSGIPKEINAGLILSATEKQAAVQLFNTGKQQVTFCLELTGYGTVTQMIDGETGSLLENTSQGWTVTIGGGKALAIVVDFE